MDRVLVLAVLPVLALLVCPLMMVACVFGMRRIGGDTSRSAASSSAVPREQQVADLQRQLQAIQTELTTLQAGQQAAAGGDAAEAAAIGVGHAA
ncbi:MAG: DUF2933 domain-containing protein [Thermomicrobiales bacterium]